MDVGNSLESQRFPLDQCSSKRVEFSTSHYVTDILVPLLEWPKTQIGGSDRKLIVRIDNAGPHRARVTLKFLKQNGMKRALHSPYSPDLAPSDFYLLSLMSYLFGYIKQLLAGHEFLDREALLEAVRHILANIEKATIDRVFLAWMERVDRCITTNGEYVKSRTL
jgi:histone-lysine N-methyltransferase SETMAR